MSSKEKIGEAVVEHTPVIGVVPARGGSKRAPGKNTALFQGKALVAHTIAPALEAKCFSDIVLTTDSPEVRRLTEGYPIAFHERSNDLANDEATILQVIRSLGSAKQWSPDTIVVLLQVTAPLRSVEDIRQAYQLFTRSGNNCAVVSVTENDYPVQLTMRIENERLIPTFPEVYKKGLRKQNQVATYRWNDAVMVDTVRNLSDPDRVNLFGEDPIPYVMPLDRSIAIDYPFQLEVCQALGNRNSQ